MNRTYLAALAASALLAALTGCSSDKKETAWPSKPVRLVVPFPAGGSTDAVSRLIAQRLSEKLGQQFVVDNRPGAGGNIGTDQVAKADPDGYTLTLTTSGPLANNQYLYQTMPYAQKDLAPIVLVGEIPLVIAATDKIPAKDLKSFIALAKSGQGTYAIGNPGNGTIGHLAFELLKRTTQAPLQGVPYKGDVPALTDLIGNSVQAVVAPITAFIPYIKDGRITGLAVTSKQRYPGTPNVPTALEQGIDLDASVWFAIAGPAGVPRNVVDTVNREVNVILKSDEGRATLEQFGALVGGGSPEDLGKLMTDESAKWKRIIEAANIRLD
ncbi:Bug family tripartite tricarboxylate transporter substrate binding protein [Pigmentiphaga litoralis]|uniref:Tripartite-type tricarboxylate transporter receptor subunit TctC n=1 Tax=Pigmentiphaga litoralis TaxID=516702 RepID=A0A7Y9LNB1_9BURK|nr:tripartite tricarboxylate transporter substrate binding protein [Pigmentiphaga litoralis]NYE23408.1 tripartite-type tricarboxylate transporter receptor subunit TctC [Pigmentiphaga litoralis]NYE82978.1 tripartite-type tricarboxylate transporter receptor subunit TctC [Pigmentiphaga litoralis]